MKKVERFDCRSKTSGDKNPPRRGGEGRLRVRIGALGPITVRREVWTSMNEGVRHA